MSDNEDIDMLGDLGMGTNSTPTPQPEEAKDTQPA